MYTSFYNLCEKPFQISTDPRFLWLGEKHKEALAVLKFGLIDQKGFLLLTGDVGTGKTTLVNALLKSLDSDVLVASVTDPALDLIDFLNHIARSFNIPRRFDKKEEFLHDFKRFLENTCLHNGKHVLLIIDEAHKLSKELLEQVRLLSNIETPEKKLINMFFVGQNELNQTLMSNDCRALRQRISLNYNIKPLSANETGEYIKHRLKVAGTEEPIFSVKSINEIHRFSDGSPRLINIICDRALLTGYVTGQKRIPLDVILECSQEILLPGETQLGSFSDLPQPSSAESLPSSVEHPLIRNNGTIFQQNGNKDFPLEDPAPANKGMSTVERIKAKVRWKSASAWRPKIKGLIKGALMAINFYVPKRRRLIYGGATSLLVLFTVFFPLNYLVSKSDHQEPTPLVLNSRARIENDNVFPSPSVTSVDEQTVVTSTDENINAQTDGEADPGKRSSLDQAKEALEGKKFSHAVELLEDVMARREGNQSEIKTLYVQALIGQARLLLTKDTDQTEKLLRKAVKTDPENAMVYYNLGKLYAKKKDYIKAIDVYSKAAELNPDSADTFFNLGFTYAAIKNYVNAEKMFLRASELEPTYLDKAIFNLAMVQYKQGKQEQCFKNLEKALEVNPSNQRARTYLERLTP